MPILEFKCPAGHVTERIVRARRNSELLPNKTICPQCRKVAVRILSAPAAPQFTGSGFYATDYKGK